MWHSIALQIAKTLAQPFTIDKRQLILKTPNGSFYLVSHHQYTYTVRIADKKNARTIDHMTQNQLSMGDWFYAPPPIFDGSTADFYFVVYPEFHVTSPQIASTLWVQLGKQLACMHNADTQGMYGWDDDTQADDQVQPNRWNKNWSTFFAEQRIGWQLTLLQEKDLLHTDINELIHVVRTHLTHYQPHPSHLHGYLDAGSNLFSTAHGLYTPDNACYYGDRELDLAWLKLTTPEHFDTILAGYREYYQVETGFDSRQNLYLLYPMLIKLHHNAEYRERIHQQIDKILAI